MPYNKNIEYRGFSINCLVDLNSRAEEEFFKKIVHVVTTYITELQMIINPLIEITNDKNLLDVLLKHETWAKSMVNEHLERTLPEPDIRLTNLGFERFEYGFI